MRIMTPTADLTTSHARWPTRRRARSRSRPEPDLSAAARAEDAALRRRADRHRAGAPARPAVLGHRAGRSSAEAQHHCEIVGGALVGRRRTLPHHRRRARSARAVPRAEPLRRRRSGAARPVPRVHDAVPPTAVPQTSRASAMSRGVLAPGAQRPRARSARARDQRRPLDVRLRPARQRQDGHRAGHSQPAATATSAIPHALEVEGRSSASSIRSITSRSTTAPTTRRRAWILGDRRDARWVRCRRPWSRSAAS